MKPDFGLVAGDYASHRAGFPDSFFERLRGFGVGLKGQVVVDLGTGTGSLARGFASRGCRVTGIDPAAEMLDQARRLGRDEGVEVEYRLARAEETGLPDGFADVVTAGQCWHWFDRRAATRESARLLREEGALVIAHFDWLPLSGNVVEATEQLVLAHNPEWKAAGGLGVHGWWLRGLGEAGFRGIETFSYDVDVPYTPEDWRGRVRASAGVAATLPEERVAAFDRELEALLKHRFPGSPFSIPHRVFAIVSRRPASAG